jgi:VanZ family protein
VNPGESSAAPTRRRLYLSLLVAWVILTFLLTSLPIPEIPQFFPLTDKAAHLGFYAVMGFLCGLWRRESGVSAGRAVLEALLFTASAGAIDEVHQHWIPGRSTELLDWVMDVLGGGFGGWFSVLFPSVFPFLLTE